jgi:hypothetical protein
VSTGRATIKDLQKFPNYKFPPSQTIYRIYRTFSPDGQARDSWFFSSAENTHAGRFDLLAPKGTCYFACSAIGAWLEVFRGALVKDRQDMENRRIAHVSRKSSAIHLADLASQKSISFKVTLDIASGNDYKNSQSWASELEQNKFAGVRALLRHDPSGGEHTIGIFGSAGPSTAIPGWQTISTKLEDEALLLSTLHTLTIVDTPYDIKTVKPFAAQTVRKVQSQKRVIKRTKKKS